ncbi:hypothetical protein F8M41_006289 [Gigaspora margarita]|uniref:Uncharacterized protein n=1 Tax=Gigaspora margarita TaxID=4874 RepID=A0A8H3X9R9_GIGMA|nr:hypothetical protein F8M41_006289 [Gigaspora margarita]
MSIAQLISEATAVLTKHDKVNEESSDVDTESEYSKREIGSPDVPWSDTRLLILTGEVVGIALIISFCLVYLCPYCLGFGEDGIRANSWVSTSQSRAAKGGPGIKSLLVIMLILVVLFFIALVILYKLNIHRIVMIIRYD